VGKVPPKINTEKETIMGKAPPKILQEKKASDSARPASKHQFVPVRQAVIQRPQVRTEP
jgi:hypothetical protein